MFDSAIVVGDSDFASLFNDLRQGGYVAVFAEPTRYPRVGLMVEDSGFEVRDSLHVALGSGPTGQVECHWVGMLARKPFIGTVAQNILTHGVGGLNIDECRVGTDEVVQASASGGSPFGPGQYALGEGRTASTSSGRWPANSVLVHSVDCTQVGEHKETIDIPRADLSVVNPARSGGANGTVTNVRHKDARYTETHINAVYECLQGCPVLTLDNQSGQVKGATWNRTESARLFNNNGLPTDHETTKTDTSVVGAGRYFMNLTWSPKDTGSLPASLLDYIQRLITPTQGTCLHVHK